jgi:hypothetical protein
MHIGKGKQKSREHSKIFIRTHKLVERREVMQLETSYIPFCSKSVSEDISFMLDIIPRLKQYNKCFL